MSLSKIRIVNIKQQLKCKIGCLVAYYLCPCKWYTYSFSSGVVYIELFFSFVTLVLMDKAHIIPHVRNRYFFSVHSQLPNVVCTLIT
jgi:hypothetical protein